jgi:hypothetical protein
MTGGIPSAGWTVRYCANRTLHEQMVKQEIARSQALEAVDRATLRGSP